MFPDGDLKNLTFGVSHNEQGSAASFTRPGSGARMGTVGLAAVKAGGEGEALVVDVVPSEAVCRLSPQYRHTRTTTPVSSMMAATLPRTTQARRNPVG